MHRQLHWVAPEGRQIITHGASRGLASCRSQAPAGAKEIRMGDKLFHLVRRLRGWSTYLLFPTADVMGYCLAPLRG